LAAEAHFFAGFFAGVFFSGFVAPASDDGFGAAFLGAGCKPGATAKRHCRARNGKKPASA
jgi:hypothetical protein